MARQLTVVQPVQPGDHSTTLRGDPGAWLPHARAAGPHAWRITLHVGGVERAVLCEVGDPWTTYESMRRRVVWTPLPDDADILPMERWLPALDAELHLVGATATPSLVLAGDVEVPLGRFGEAVDALVLGRVAQRGAATFLREVAARLASPELSQSAVIGAHQRS